MKERERKVDNKVYREGIKRKENKQKDGASSTTADIWTQIFFWAISSLDCTLRFPWQQKTPLPCPKVKLSQLGQARSPCDGMDAFCRSDTAGEAVRSNGGEKTPPFFRRLSDRAAAAFLKTNEDTKKKRKRGKR